MKLETKYEVGQRIWIVYEDKEEVHLYDDLIVNILINEDREIIYCTKEAYEELNEDEIILYEEAGKLINKIKELLNNVTKKKAGEAK